MPRQPRVEVPGGFYHVVSRGNNKQDILDDALRPLCLWHVNRAAVKFDWLVYAYALMSNHVHLVVQIGESGLSAGMQQLNLALARASNARFGRINHCLGQRFWSTHLEGEQHLLASVRYTLWNPARAGVGDHPRDSIWTSYRGSAGLDWPHEVLAVAPLLRLFGSNPVAAQRAFRGFVSEGRVRCQAPWQKGDGMLT